MEPSHRPKVAYTENSMEFGEACEDLSCSHRTSTLHRSETIGIAERAVRRVRLDERWWSDSYGMLLSAKCPRLLGRREDAIWKTIWRTIQRTNNIFWSNGWISSISPKDQVRIHRFDKKVLPGIFLGCVLITGGIWKGDILKADLEDLEKLDASEIYLRRINAKEVLVRQKRWWIHISNCRMVQQNRQEGTTNSKNHL